MAIDADAPTRRRVRRRRCPPCTNAPVERPSGHCVLLATRKAAAWFSTAEWLVRPLDRGTVSCGIPRQRSGTRRIDGAPGRSAGHARRYPASVEAHPANDDAFLDHIEAAKKRCRIRLAGSGHVIAHFRSRRGDTDAIAIRFVAAGFPRIRERLDAGRHAEHADVLHVSTFAFAFRHIDRAQGTCAFLLDAVRHRVFPKAAASRHQRQNRLQQQETSSNEAGTPHRISAAPL